jgi:hypothetical protein
MKVRAAYHIDSSGPSRKLCGEETAEPGRIVGLAGLELHTRDVNHAIPLP